MEALAGPSGTVFYAGRKFSSFEEVTEEIKKFEDKTFTKYYIRDSRKIVSARTKVTNIKPTLVYSELKYACFKGGRRVQKRGTGVRENTR